MKQIVDIRLKEVQDRLTEKRMTLRIEEGAKEFLCASGHSPIYGARPLNLAIRSGLLDPLSIMILSDQVHDGQTIRVAFDNSYNRLVIMPMSSEKPVERDRARTRTPRKSTW
jgi:ATP-dependent Clp protease ATP-binding subunit ClpB